MPRLLALLMLCSITFLPVFAAAVGNVPKAADDIAKQMDKQLMIRFGGKSELCFSSENRALRNRISVMTTVPVNLNNLEVSCPLARQMAEEITRWMVNAGYQLEELRKGKDIFFSRPTGETLLTRNTNLLATRQVSSEAVLVGTYVITPDQVRFNVRLLHTPSNEVLAMGTATVPITDDVIPLLTDNTGKALRIAPSIGTRLQ